MVSAMANLQTVSTSTDNEVPDQFPAGLRILVVDDDITFLKIIEQMSIRCHYQVTTCSEAAVALNLLREKKDCFDVVLSNVQMPDMDGYKFLEHVGQEMNLPVILMSVDGTASAVMKGFKHGACHYLIKPVREEDLRNIWQHVVVRKNWNENKEHENSGSLEDNDDDRNKRGNDDSEYASSSIIDATEGIVKAPNKRGRSKEGDIVQLGNDDPSTTKKPRVVWSVELHQQFVNAVIQLGLDKAVPKRILELMDVPGLTRENVASHLQKFRLHLKKSSGVAQQQNRIPNTFPGTMESKLGANGRIDIQALASAGHVPHAEHAVAYGQPLVRCPSNIAKNFPQSIITVDDASSGYGAWAWPPSSNTIGSVVLNSSIGRLGVQNNNVVMDIFQHQQRHEHQQKQQQLQQQSLMHDQIHSINVQPSCLVVPSQPSGTLHEGNSPASVNHNCIFGGNSLIDYGIFSPQSNNSLNIAQFPGENTKARGLCSGYTTPSSTNQQLQNSTLTCGAVRPFPGLSPVSDDTQVPYGSRSSDSLHQASLKNVGYDVEDTSIQEGLLDLKLNRL